LQELSQLVCTTQVPPGALHANGNSGKRRKAMRAMSATGFTGYGDLKLVDLPKPEIADGISCE
jgi:hypothetical protein